LEFVRAFSSASDLKPEHDVLNRALDIVAGPADPSTRVDALKSPVALTTDSGNRVFVADPAARTVHIFDLAHSRYGRLDTSGRMSDPVAVAIDAQNNLYVVDQISRTVFVYDSAGKFRRALGKLRGGESYFESPSSIAVDHSTGRIYICDRLGNMIFVMDQRGKILRRIGKRGAGEGPAEFRLPGQVILCGKDLCVLDSGNSRIQVLDTDGHFKRSINVGYAGHGAGLAADNQGNLYLSDPGVDQIQVFSRDGAPLHILEISAVHGGIISHPSALWIDARNKLYAIDSQENRVGEFEILGRTPQ
jgi:DNA-binding beta-propeller fold protein YncE